MKTKTNLPGFTAELIYPSEVNYHLKCVNLQAENCNSVLMQARRLPPGMGGLTIPSIVIDGGRTGFWGCQTACTLGCVVLAPEAALLCIAACDVLCN